MQNRNMFLYRRQGPKKRPKSGTPRKGRSPQKGLPNSARDLLPIIQPATKALAQMLAGRTAASGQLGHARAVLTQTEKLVAERAHNRLNPAEREEFFEQVARLKLTLSDAESEAEFQAAEEQQPAPPPVPVDRERLKAMAMSLTSTGAKNAAAHRASEEEAAFESRSNNARTALNEKPAEDLETASAGDTLPHSTGEDDERASAAAASDEQADRPIDPKQLRLPRNPADKLALQSAAIGGIDGTPRRRKATSPRNKIATKPSLKAQSSDSKENELGVGAETLGHGKAKGGQKLPKGWIIDDEGFVVPGTS